MSSFYGNTIATRENDLAVTANLDRVAASSDGASPRQRDPDLVQRDIGHRTMRGRYPLLWYLFNDQCRYRLAVTKERRIP